jgi:hypothetical protein
MVLHKTRPEYVSHGRGAHWQSGMTGVCLLDSVYGKKPDGIDTESIELRLVE